MERVSFPYVSPVTQSCCLQGEKENCFAKEVCAPQDAKGDDAARSNTGVFNCFCDTLSSSKLLLNNTLSVLHGLSYIHKQTI